MSLKVAVVGYGNLGKSLESNVLQNKQTELVAVFSRRRIANPRYLPLDEIASYKGKIDVLLLAQGSYCDLENNIRKFADFHTVDSFDTHGRMQQYRALLNATKPKKISVFAAGWDPGVLSLVRAAFAVTNPVVTFWGKGISQGHSNALKQLDGVVNAVSVTLPSRRAQRLFLKGKHPTENQMHTRHCYIATDQNANREKIRREILSMPNYFCGQNVKIHFCDNQRVEKLKIEKSHRGRILSNANGIVADTRLKVANNVDYTAKIMISCALAVPQLIADGFCGALSPLDIPLKYLISENVL